MFLWEPAFAVTCSHCKDTIPGCAGGAACPLHKTVAENMTRVAAAAGGVISLMSLVPDRIMAVFTRPVLDGIASAVSRATTGAKPYDFSGKPPAQIVTAVFEGLVSFTEAGPQLLALQAASTEAKERENITSALQLLSTFSQLKQAPRGSTSSYYLMIWALVSNYVMAADDRAAVPGRAGSAEEHASSGGKLGDAGMTATSAKIKDPQTAEQFFEMLTWFPVMTHALGICSVLVCVPFIDDVVHRGIRRQGHTWELSYCLLLVYLKHVELAASEDVHLGNIYNSGGQDTKIREAEEKARGVFGATFRTRRGEPRVVRENGKKEWNKAFNNSSTAVPCAAYNNKADHEHKSLHGDGTCKYAHVCNQFVSDKGPGGQCRGNHPRKDCDYPLDKRLNKALAA